MGNGKKIADRFKVQSTVPVSVAKPSLKRLRGHEEGMDAVQLAAKKYRLTKEEVKEVKRGQCGGAAVEVDMQKLPEEPKQCAAMAALRRHWLAKTLPRTVDIAPTARAELGAKTTEHHTLLTQAIGHAPRVTGRKARFARMGVKGQKWEMFIWGKEENDVLGLGYGTFTEALFLALDSSVATLIRRVSERNKAAAKGDTNAAEAAESEASEEAAAALGNDADPYDSLEEGEEDEEGEEAPELSGSEDGLSD